MLTDNFPEVNIFFYIYYTAPPPFSLSIYLSILPLDLYKCVIEFGKIAHKQS
jgi:hypothetical protein